MDQTFQDIKNTISPYTDIEEQNKIPIGFDLKNCEQIVCIELINNNYIYLRYEESWTIEDLINKVLNHTESLKLYPNRHWQLTAQNHKSSLFDLHLALYRSIKDQNETKVDHKMTLGALKNMGLLKNHKHPFFIFKDNRNTGSLITTYEDKYELFKKMCKKQSNYYSIYQNYLPRVGALFLVKAHPELETYFIESRKDLNTLSPYNLNPLLSCDNNVNWFTYDDESMLFLALFEMKNFNVVADIKYALDGKVYLEDKFPKITLKEKDLENFYLKCTFVAQNPEIGQDIITKKLKISIKTTGFDILESMSKKLEQMSEEFAFDPKTKILKVRSLNDYVLTLTIPLVRFTYINHCIVTNSEAEYVIIDNPFSNNEVLLSEGFLDDVKDTEYEAQALKNENLITVHNDQNTTLLDNYNYRNIMTITSYINDKKDKKNLLDNDDEDEGGVNQEEKEQNEDPNNKKKNILDNFVKSIHDEIQQQTKETIEECSKVISDQNGTVIFDESSWDVSVISQSMNATTNNVSLFHPIPHRKIVSKKVNPNDRNISTENVTQQRPSIMVDSTSFASKKRRSRINIPNVFKEMGNTTPDISGMLRDKNEMINIAKTMRPFSIIFREAFLTKKLDSYPDINRFKKPSIISFCFQLYCGSEPLSKMKKITLTCDSDDLHPVFNKRIYFDLFYHNLPPFVSLNITIKHMIYNSTKNFDLEKIIGWVNFRLFDHKKRLMTGKHKVSLLETQFSEDSFYCFIDNINDKQANAIYFEIDSFSVPLHYENVQLSENFQYNPSAIMVSKTDEDKIREIIKRNPFEELNNYDKEVLWNNRYKLSQEPAILPKLLKCVDYTNANHLLELEKILSVAKLLPPIQSMELLTGKFLHESIRNFGVKCLAQATPQEFESYLIQLVQGLKYEMHHDSELSRYLLLMAISYPLTIGHTLFWSIRSEIYNPIVQQRFGLYLEVFLDKIGENLREIFTDESLLITHLIKAAEVPTKTGLTEAEEKALLQDHLIEINDNIERSRRKEISLPINFKYRGKCIKREKCGILRAPGKPLLIVLENCDPTGQDFVIEFRLGVDLRKDIVCLQLFKIMQQLWFENDLKTKMSIYHLVGTGLNQGMVEIVKHSKSLSKIYKEESGPFKALAKSQITNWIQHNGILSEEELLDNFLMSCIAYCTATFALGISDRTTENVFIKTNAEVYHAKFIQLLGFNNPEYLERKYKKNPPFLFTKHFVNYLGGERSKKYQEFKQKLWKAYNIIRGNIDVIIALLRILLSTGLPELRESSIQFLETTMCLNFDTERAKEFFKKMYEISVEF